MDAEVTFRTVFREEAGVGPRDRTGLRLPTVAAVAALHIVFIATLAVLSRARQTPPPPVQMSIPVIFAPAAPEASEPAPEALASSTVPVPAAEVPAMLATLPAVTLPPAHTGLMPRRPVARPIPHDVAHPAVSTPAAAAMQQPATAPAMPAPATASEKMVRAMATWEARVRQAVQDAAIYPASARLLHRQGSAQIRFDYDRGAIAAAAIAQSSHFSALDTAALEAVTRAAIPDPPTEIGPQKRTMLVWVQFTLRSEE